jgi:hypothetical protein
LNDDDDDDDDTTMMILMMIMMIKWLTAYLTTLSVHVAINCDTTCTTTYRGHS